MDKFIESMYAKNDLFENKLKAASGCIGQVKEHGADEGVQDAFTTYGGVSHGG